MSTEAPPPVFKVFVQNLQWKTTEEALKKEFEKFGPVEEVKIVTGRDRGVTYSRGFGFVTFKDEGSMRRCLDAQKVELDGRTLNIKEARPPSPPPPPRPDSALKVFVQNLAWKTTEEALKKEFEKFGPVGETKIITDFYHGKTTSRGFGFVTFADEGSARRCLEAKDVVIDGRTLIMKPAKEPVARETGPPPVKAPLTIFCRNLKWETTAAQLGEAFSDCDVKDCKIPTEMWKGQKVSRGIGFVTFNAEEGFRKALAKDGFELGGRRIRIREAFAPRPRVRDTLFIGGLPVGTKEEEIRGQFSGYQVKSVRLVRFDEESNRGYAFVQFVTHEDQDKAGRARRDITLGGKRSIIRWARGRAPAPRRRGSRRYGRRAPRRNQ